MNSTLTVSWKEHVLMPSTTGKHWHEWVKGKGGGWQNDKFSSLFNKIAFVPTNDAHSHGFLVVVFFFFSDFRIHICLRIFTYRQRREHQGLLSFENLDPFWSLREAVTTIINGNQKQKHQAGWTESSINTSLVPPYPQKLIQLIVYITVFFSSSDSTRLVFRHTSFNSFIVETR